VHSSTSSFRTLPGGWFSLLVGGLLSLGLLTGWELFWRGRAYEPTLTDTEALWCRERKAVGTRAVVIVGSSRLQAGIDPQVMSRVLGGTNVVQLAINGANALPVLRDLAADESFAGTVVLEYMPLRMFTADSWSVARADGFVVACAHITLVAQIDAVMSRVLQQRFALMNPELHPLQVLSRAVRQHALPQSTNAHLRDDRYLSLSFGAETQDEGLEQAQRWGVLDSEANVDARLGVLRKAIAQIESRGGRVIIYRPPVSRGVLADEESHYPAYAWLPRTARALGAAAIDFATMAGFKGGKAPGVGFGAMAAFEGCEGAGRGNHRGR